MPGLRVVATPQLRQLVLDRPERRNPLTLSLREALAAELQAAVERGTRVLLIRSEPAEPPVFAAGADLSDIAALGPAEAPAFARRGQALFQALEDAPVLVLAAVDGPCFGGALDLALSCDFVGASARARFAHPGARLGIVTGWGGTRRLPRRLGRAAAAAAFATGRPLEAEAARRLGLVQVTLDGRGKAFARAAESWAQGWAEALEGLPAERIGTLKRVLAASPAGARALELAALRRFAAEAGFRASRA